MKRLGICAVLALASCFAVGSVQVADLPAELTDPAVATQDNEASVDLARHGGRYGGGYYYGRPAYAYRPYYSYRPSYSYSYSYRPYYNYNYRPYYYSYNYRPYYRPYYGPGYVY